MKYLCLVYLSEQEFYNLPAGEIERAFGEGEQLALELQRLPGYRAADALEPTSTAATVRVRDGSVLVSDGPFAETKEQLAGFVLIDADNLDDAIAVAARVPAARFGSVEVRPVRELTGSGVDL